jgi:hypothetical protein
MDSDSGISSVRRSSDKVAAFTTDDDELLPRANSINNEDDEQIRRESDASSITNFTITKTSSEFPSSSITNSRSSGINVPSSEFSMVAISSKQSLVAPLMNPTKKDKNSKHGVRHFLRKMFGSSRNQETTQTLNNSLNIDLVNGTAYPVMSPLPITQGPIRLFVLRHGERLDRYYSSQWLRQAFDKDGNFCRFSPILP